MNRFERRKRAIDEAIRGHITEYKANYKKADDEDRDPTDEERLDIESHLKAIEVLRYEKEDVEANIKTLQHVDDIGREIGPEFGRELVDVSEFTTDVVKAIREGTQAIVEAINKGRPAGT